VRVFSHGMMADKAIRQVVLGRAALDKAAVAQGLALRAAGSWPVAVRAAGKQVPGVVMEGVTADELARLDFFLAVLGQAREAVALDGAAEEVWSHVGQADGPDWDAVDWAERFAAIWRATAPDVMALFGRVAPEVVAARLGSMLVRGASRVRAGRSGPTTLRHRASAGDMQIASQREPYARFFAVDEYDVAWRRFDGEMSDTVTRAAFLSGDAVTVLPYDPRRDRVLVVEQFRAGPHARGDAQCWQIEAIAGRIDPGETPETAARREAVEEAGLILTDLLEVARYYPSPGAVSEYLYSYVALTDLPDGAAGVFGVAGETEDIRGHLLSFARFIDLVSSGEIENAPLILTALWLQRERSRLMV
jgi:ADP-ribose pyrophosphatase